MEWNQTFLIQEQQKKVNKIVVDLESKSKNGYPHYKVHDNLTDNEIHCDMNELNETIWELLGV